MDSIANDAFTPLGALIPAIEFDTFFFYKAAVLSTYANVTNGTGVPIVELHTISSTGSATRYGISAVVDCAAIKRIFSHTDFSFHRRLTAVAAASGGAHNLSVTNCERLAWRQLHNVVGNLFGRGAGRNSGCSHGNACAVSGTTSDKQETKY